MVKVRVTRPFEHHGEEFSPGRIGGRVIPVTILLPGAIAEGLPADCTEILSREGSGEKPIGDQDVTPANTQHVTGVNKGGEA